MRTFSIDTLGCKVNQYESEQIATLLRSRGLTESASAGEADLRVVNTCSVTMQAAGKSRQAVRRRAVTSLPVLGQKADHPAAENIPHRAGARVVVTGCWATSDKTEAEALPGVSAVLGHHDDVAAELTRLVDGWILEDDACRNAEEPVANSTDKIEMPLLDRRYTGHQRAFLKIQDGCDAHCTYCIIPRLRPTLASKPIDDAVAEAQRLVDGGHVEIVLTGIFMGAYGQPTALRRRQPVETVPRPLGQLIEALCTRVSGLRRIRLSSLEPGDLTGDLIAILKSHPQVVPHFHLPLQSGSDALLRRMNRQYTRTDFLRMIDRVTEAFDRPAITTDIICGFPGETDAEFAQTLDVVDHAKFIHIHAFSFSPRPGTAAARWTKDFIRGPVVNERINILSQRATQHSLGFRQQFVGQSVELLVERPTVEQGASLLQQGRCERYFAVHFEYPRNLTGRAARVRVDRVTPDQTFGIVEGVQ